MHDTNELVTVVAGCIEVCMHGECYALEPGDELFVPRGVPHTVRNVHPGETSWFSGYD